MPPHADDSERCEVGAGGRVQPARAAPAQAWLEREEPDTRASSPRDDQRLLTPPEPRRPPRLQAGLVLVVRPPKKLDFTTEFRPKTRYQKRKEKLIAALKPPYFILSMITFIVLWYVCVSRDVAARLQWEPGAWWREPWRVLTYALVHAHDAHLAINAIVALAVGWVVEREQRWWRVALVWVGGVAGGALGAGALQPQMRVVGASAAVYALLTAHLANVAHRFGHIPLWWFRPLSVLVLVTSEACWALVGAGNARGDVAWSAHLFGATVGLPLAVLVFTGENSGTRYMLIARVLSALFLGVLVVLAGVHYASWQEPRAYHPPRDLALHYMH